MGPYGCSWQFLYLEIMLEIEGEVVISEDELGKFDKKLNGAGND